jgi:hypothetical protein
VDPGNSSWWNGRDSNLVGDASTLALSLGQVFRQRLEICLRESFDFKSYDNDVLNIPYSLSLEGSDVKFPPEPPLFLLVSRTSVRLNQDVNRSRL